MTKLHGGQPGNQNAAKPNTAKRVSIRLYKSDRDRVKVMAAALGLTYSATIRQAVFMMAQKMGYEGKNND